VAALFGFVPRPGLRGRKEGATALLGAVGIRMAGGERAAGWQLTFCSITVGRWRATVELPKAVALCKFERAFRWIEERQVEQLPSV